MGTTYLFSGSGDLGVGGYAGTISNGSTSMTEENKISEDNLWLMR